MKVYVEYALADNLFFDWLLVRLTARLTKIPVRGGRIFLAAAVGAVGAVASALTEGVWAVVAKIAVFVAIVAVAFGSRRIKKTFLAAAVFAFITFAAGAPTVTVSGYTRTGGDDPTKAAGGETWEFDCLAGYILWKNWGTA